MINTMLVNRWINYTPRLHENTNKELIELLEGIQIGEILEGLIINKIEMGYVLELNSGVRIPISILKDLGIGNHLECMVMDKKQGEIQVQIQSSKQLDFIDQVIEQLGLVQTSEMKKCVECFMDKELPLTKENLLKTHYLHKQYSIPSEIIVNTLAKKSGLTERELECLVKLKEHGIQTYTEQLKDIILGLEKEEDVADILRILSKEIVQQEGGVEQDKETGKVIEEEIVWTRVGDKSLNNIGKEMRDCLEKLYDQAIVVDSKGERITIKEKVENIGDKILEIIEHIDDKVIGSEEKQILKIIKEEVMVIQKMSKEGDYFIFPVLINDTLNHGEVYFYQPKQSKKTKSQESMYIVIALDLGALRHIEVHIHKIDKIISIDMILETEEIKQYLMRYIHWLKKEIEEMEYTLEQCSYRIRNKEEVWGKIKKSETYQTIIDVKA